MIFFLPTVYYFKNGIFLGKIFVFGYAVSSSNMENVDL